MGGKTTRRRMFSEEIRECRELTCGEVVNGWKAVEFIGEGGFGKVFRVKKGRLTGALKIYSLPEDLDASGADEKWRFWQEIRLLKAAKGEFAPMLYDSGEFCGVPYFVMEYLTPLKPSTMPRTDAEIQRMMLDLTAAVGKLHDLRLPGSKARGWIHCDIKPYNVGRMSDGKYVLIDFGSAHERDPEGVPKHQVRENSKNVRSGVYRICSTKYYDPPDLTFTPARDIYALGHLLRDCFKDTVPLEWSLIINKCISWQPDYRYKNASKLSDDVVNIERKKQEIYWDLRKKKIKEQRDVERSLAKAVPKVVEWEAILSVDRDRSAPDLTVLRIRLEKDPATCFIVEEPLKLKENTVLLISGRGVLKADISGPASSIVVLLGYAALNNLNAKCPPENELLYAIVGPGGYLNLPNIEEKDRPKFFLEKGKRRIFRDIDATTAFRFNGPDTFSDIEKQSIDGLRKSDLPKRYRDQLMAFLKGDEFSVMPRKYDKSRSSTE